MSTAYSFDTVNDFNLAEMNNAIEQAKREVGNRYDFKGTAASLDFSDQNKKGLQLTGESEYQIDALLDIIRKKLAARGVDQKVLDTSKPRVTGNFKVKLEVPFKQGLDQEKAKKITSVIREHFPKVKTQMQGDSVRVTSASKDELQAVMQLLRGQSFDFPLEFINYR